MALSAADAQAAQGALTGALSADLASVWAQTDTSDPSWLTRFVLLVAAVVHRYGLASGSLAAQTYTAERTAAGAGTPFRVALAPLPPPDQIAATVGWATAPVRAEQPDLGLARTQLEGAVDRLVLDVGRRTLTDAVSQDRAAKGWARLTRPGACSFCRLLATRGAVYKSDRTAGRDASARFVGEGEFKFHNHCHCYVEPLFTTYEPTAQARADLALYKQVTKGLSGVDARNAFRRAVESE